jgi:hypothetical protein
MSTRLKILSVPRPDPDLLLFLFSAKSPIRSRVRDVIPKSVAAIALVLSFSSLATAQGVGTSDSLQRPFVEQPANANAGLSVRIGVVSPAALKQGATGVTVQIFGIGTAWDNSTQIDFGSVITFGLPAWTVNSGSSITAIINIPAEAPLGLQPLTVQTRGQILTASVDILSNPPQPTGTPALVSASGVTPGQGMSFSAGILGRFTNFATNSTTVSLGNGITVSGVTVNGPTSLSVTGTVDPFAFVGNRNITVATGTQVLMLPNAFSVTQGPAAVTTVNPNSGMQGQTFDVALTGTSTHFSQNVTVAGFGQGISVNTLTVSSATAATANITIAANASAQLNSVTLTTLGEVATAANSFTISTPPTSIGSLTPASLGQGQATTINLTGTATHWVNGNTAADLGAGITVNSTTITSATAGTVSITVSPTATVGTRTVQMITNLGGGNQEVASKTGGFTVTASQAGIMSATPTAPTTIHQNDTNVTIVIVGMGTHFASNSTVAFCSGITAVQTTPNSATQLTVTANVSPSAPLGACGLTVNTGGEVASGTNLFNILAGLPVVTSVSPVSAHQNDQNVTLTVTGAYTNFVNGTTTASFGSGITVNSVSVISSTSATVNISVSPGASVGGSTVTMTTGTQTASLANGFSVTAGLPQISGISPNTGTQNSTQTITINGLYTNFAPGQSVVSFSGGNVTAGTATVNGPAQITVSVSVAAGAAATARTVTVTTGSEVATLPGSFTVQSGAPTITTISPTVGVPNTASLTVTLSGLFTSWVNGSTQATFGPGISVNGAAIGAYGTVVVTNSTTAVATLTIDPAATLGARNVTVQTPGTPAQIIAVNNGFTVQSTVPTAPTIITVAPAHGSTGVPINTSYTVVFSGPIDPATAGSNNAILSRTQDGCSTSLAVASAINVDASGRILTLTPSSVLAVGNGYYFCLNSNAPPYIKDPSGLTIGGAAYNFTTGFATSNIGPTYIGGSVGGGDINVGTNVTPILGFDKAINTVTQLSGLNVFQGSTNVAGVWSYNSTFTQATFTPAGGFAASAVYTIQMTTSLTDSVGNPLTNPQSISFTTGTGPDTITATLVSYTPANNSTTGENPTIRLVYSKAMNPLTITQGQFYLTQNVTGRAVLGTTVTASADRKTFTMSIPGPLDPNTQYYSYICPPYDQAQHYAGCNQSVFITGPSIDTTSPTVTSVSPPNGFTGIAVNAPIRIQLSKAIDATTVNAISLTLTPAVAGAVTLDSPTTMTFSPAANLAVSQSYTVNAAGFYDQNGNTVTPFSSTFTTSSSITPDTTHGNITMAPASGAAGVPTNAVVVFTFSKPFNPITVNNGGNIRLYDNTASAYVGGALTLNAALTSVTFTPSVPLVPNHQYCGYGGYPFSTYIYDIAGNYFNYLYSQCFTTAAGADNTPPTVITVMPAANAVGIGPNNPVTVTFSKPMNPTTLSNTNVAIFVGSTLYNRSFNVSFDNTTLTFNAGNLPYNTTFTVVVTPAVTDLANNHLASQYISSFTTIPQPTTAVPTVTAVRPASGATGVLRNGAITWFVSAPLKTATVPGAIKVSQNGVLITGNVTYASNNQVVVFTPSANFLPGANVTAFFTNSATDNNGNPLITYQFSFTVVPSLTSTNPTILSTSPAQYSSNVIQNPVIDVQFSKPLDPATVIPANFYLNNCAGTGIAGTLSLLSGNTVVRFTPGTALPVTCTYSYVNVTGGIKDTSGLAFAATNWYFYYTATPDTAAPAVKTIAPTNNVTGIGTNSTIRIQFSEAIDPITVNTSNLTLTGNAASIPWQATFDSTGTVLTVIPQAALPASVQITVALASGVTDLAGHGLPAFSSVFTTGASPDFGTPYIISSSAVNGQTGVPVTSVFTLTYNKPVDTRTEVASNGVIYLYDNVTGFLPITLTYSSDGTQVTIQPTSLLGVNRSFSIYACGVQDLNGNSMSPCFSVSFTTALVAPTGVPTVSFVLPPNGFQIATNVSPQIQFDRSVDLTSLSGITLAQGAKPMSFTSAGSVGNTVVTLTPNSLLAPNLPYTLSVSGVKDAAGNTMSGTVTRTFTTGASIDLVVPVVAASSPASGQTTGTNAVIRTTFNEPINPITSSTSWYLSNGVTNVHVPGAALSVAADLLSEMITYPGTLDPNTQYCWYAGYVYDLAGNYTYAGSSCFTTSSGAVTTPPAVTSVTPPNGQTAVPINTVIRVFLSSPIDPTTVGAGSLTLSPTPPAPGAVSLASGGQTLTLGLGGGTLSPTTAYTLSASGFKDVNGNAVTAFTSTFTTSSLSDTSQGTISLSSPAPGSTGISINSAITVALSKVIDPVSVLPAAFQVYANNNSNQQIPGNISIGSGGTALTFTPVGPLPPGTPINIYAGYSSSLTDLAGNTFNSLFNATFTTATTADNTPPTVLSATPANGASNVGPNGVVTLIFSKALNYNTINPQNFTLYKGFTNLNATVSRSSDNRTVTLTTTLPYSSTITVAVNTTVQDLAGNFLAGPFSSTFTTRTQPLTSTPSVTQMRPSNGATGVLVNGTITLYFTAPLSAPTVPAAFYVSQNGVLLAGAVVVSGDGRSAVWTGPGFQNSAYVQVFFTGASDTSGNAVSPYSASFTAAAPASATTTLVSTSPSQYSSSNILNPVVDLQFSRGIMPSTVTSSTFYMLLLGTGSAIAGTISQYANNSILRFTPNAALQPNTYYYVYYTAGLKDVNAAPLTAGNFYFYTGATSLGTTPVITSAAPYNGATGVGDNATIRFTFNELMDTLTINATPGASTVTLMNGSTAIPFSISFSGSASTTVTLTPYAPLPDNATLTLGLTNGIADLAGHALTAQSISFQTAAGADFSAPYVTYSTIATNATAVPLNATFTLVFNKPLDRNTVNTASPTYYQIYDTTTGLTVPATITVSSDGLSVTYLPTANLAASRAYNLYAQYASDLAGNTQTNFALTFTTGATAVTTPPSVLTSNPATSTSSVPLNVLIEAQFNEAVSATSLSQITLLTGSTPVPFTGSLVFANSAVRLTPATLLSPNTTYTVTIQGVKDVAGNAMTGPYTFSFTTGSNLDNNATPNVLSVVANSVPLTNGTNVSNVPVNPTIVITLDTPVEPASVLNSGALVMYLNSNTNVTYPLNAAFSPDQKTITVTLPSGTLAAATQYQFRVGYNARLRDWAGNSNNAQYYIYIFTTQ